MGVYIRNMEMPKDGDVLTVKKDDDGKIYIKQSHMMGYSAELIEIPPHGRLIDADEFYKDINESMLLRDEVKDVFNLFFDEQPTVIP